MALLHPSLRMRKREARGKSNASTRKSPCPGGLTRDRGLQRRSVRQVLLHALDDRGDALANADAHGAKGVTRLALLQLVHGSGQQTRTGHAERMAESDRAAIRVHPAVIVGNAKLAQHGEALSREGFVQLNHVHVVDGQAEAIQQLLRGRSRTDAHDARGNTGSLHAENAGARGQTVVLRTFSRCQHGSASAIVHAGSITGSHSTRCAEGGAQLGQTLQGGAFARMLVHIDDDRVAFAALDDDRHDLHGQTAILLAATAFIWER